MPDYIARNQASWTTDSEDFETSGRRDWSADDPSWGIWLIPEAEVGMLPDVAGKDVIELGCGTGYVSAWLHRLGARPVGIDPTWTQLARAHAFQQEFDRRFPLIQAPAEAVPLADASFDIAISEYGASIWSDPYLWVPEAARLLRPGGELIFLVNGNILMLCMHDDENVPAESKLIRDYFGMHRFEWPDDDSVEFHIGYGDWIRLLRDNGFEVEDLIELRPGEGATTRYPWVTLDWARRWPCEEIWKARKR
ncbi:MAG: methyltransferase domain-containing protein [Actinobacteria bacterium]|nr:methyltransferase domain-containing protein [Actinomycetota bacterium]